MFNLFKKSAENKVEVAEKAILKGKTTNQIIEEIHDNFYTEVDRLLASAKVSKSLDTDKQALIDKCHKLKELGFINTKEVQEAEVEIKRLAILAAENANKKTLIEAINYFSFKYPNYKFITEESVKKICAKYNLVYGEVSKYIGEVPDKNLQHIKDFKVDKMDDVVLEFYRSTWGDSRIKPISYKSSELYKSELRNLELESFSDEDKWIMLKHDMMLNHYSSRVSEVVAPLEIAAPLKDFNMEGMELEGFKISKIEIPDPVVLKPVFFGGQKHYLIVTAWGLEGSDELVVNQKMN